VYEIQVRQNQGTSQYTLKIGKQKPTVDISQISTICDNIEYTDQWNKYLFVAGTNDTYQFTISEMKSGCILDIRILNALGEKVTSDEYCINGDSITLKNKEPGGVYTVQVRYESGCSSYKLTIQ